MVVASAARRARYCGTVTPPRSCSPRNVFKVMGEASFPARMSCDATSKIRRCNSSEKCSALRKSEIRSKASLLTRIAPSSACSASTLCGARRKWDQGPLAVAKRVLDGKIVDGWHSVSRTAPDGPACAESVHDMLFCAMPSAAKRRKFLVSPAPAPAIHTAEKFTKKFGWTLPQPARKSQPRFCPIVGLNRTKCFT